MTDARRQNIDVPPLPGVLAEIAEIAGRDAAMGLALKKGGQDLRIPRPEKLLEDHPLAEAVGFEAARKIAKHFKGECIYVPMGRRALVCELLLRGWAHGDVASRLGVSVSVVRRYGRGR